MPAARTHRFSNRNRSRNARWVALEPRSADQGRPALGGIVYLARVRREDAPATFGPSRELCASPVPWRALDGEALLTGPLGTVAGVTGEAVGAGIVLDFGTVLDAGNDLPAVKVRRLRDDDDRIHPSLRRR